MPRGNDETARDPRKISADLDGLALYNHCKHQSLDTKNANEIGMVIRSMLESSFCPIGWLNETSYHAVTMSPNTFTRMQAGHICQRATTAGLQDLFHCHTFRAGGITAYLEAGGSIENAQAIVAHESPRTTKLHDRAGDEITLDEIERIII